MAEQAANQRKLDQGSPPGSMAPSPSAGLMIFTTSLGPVGRSSIWLMG